MICTFAEIPKLIVLLVCESKYFVDRIRHHSQRDKFRNTHIIFSRVSVLDDKCKEFLIALDVLM